MSRYGMQLSVFRVHDSFFSGKRGKPLSVVYCIRVSRIRERMPCHCHQDTCVSDLPLALGKTKELLPSEHCFLHLVILILSDLVVGDAPRSLELDCQQIRDHEASKYTTNSRTKIRPLPAHPLKVLGQLVMTSRDLAALVYTTKKTATCRVPKVLIIAEASMHRKVCCS